MSFPSPSSQPRPTVSSNGSLITAATLKQWLQQESVLLIDVREPVEYANEHIPGAICHPLSQFNPDRLPLEPDQKVVLYCQSGKRSHQAAQSFHSTTTPPIVQLQGGITAWKAEANPVEKSQNAPISLFRQVQIIAGGLVLVGTILGVTVSPWALLLSGFVGAGFMFAGITNTCAMAMLLAKLPYNQHNNQRWNA
ncbi:MAG: rhodanese-like domain-containing protein [Synechococcales bacterium]|nr:rhodanese-like domain-containing protein [Synechococcales bacterium]